MTSRILAITVLALAGLFIAAGVTYAAGRLVSQPIGLSDHERSLEDSLTPPRTITVTRTIKTDGSAAGTQTTSVTGPDSSGGGDSSSQSQPSDTSAAPKAQSDSDSGGSGSDDSEDSDDDESHADGHDDSDHDD